VSQLALAPEEITAAFRDALGDAVVSTSTAFGQATVVVDAASWVDAVRFAKEDPAVACDFFSWLSGIEWVDETAAAAAEEGEATEAASEDTEDSAGPAGAAPEVTEAAAVDESEYRPPDGEAFQVVCHLSSTTQLHAVTLKADLDLASPRVDTITGVFGGADWHERELAEMFGVEVVGHPHLVKLYLPDHFEGHPLRKSFKLGSRIVKPWPGEVNVEDMPEDTPVTQPLAGQP